MTLPCAVTTWTAAPELVDDLLREARAAAPLEACGLLLGRLRSGCAEVSIAHPARNLDRRPSRFRVDPLDQLAAEHSAREAGLQVLGAWHSHPSGASTPSMADLAGSAYPLLGVLALDVGARREGEAHLAAWWVFEGAEARPLAHLRSGFATPH